MKIFEYKNCSTCRNAIHFLEERKIKYERIAIIDSPPTLAELKRMLDFIKKSGGTIKNLFNTSGEQYRSLKIADKIKAGLTEADALQLLAKNGKLIKRPFLLSSKFGVVGFKKEIWTQLL
jgi:arsenate reductase